MLTVTQLARKYQISRTTLLYYERVQLLKPHVRTGNGYRWYGESEARQLEAIIAYRSYGVPVKDIAALLNSTQDMEQERILRNQFAALEQEIKRLRHQQKAILMLLEQPSLLEQQMVNKERWVEIMKAAGFDEEAMKNWHRQFEKMEPDAHQEFLESLSISKEEIRTIREWSRN